MPNLIDLPGEVIVTPEDFVMKIRKSVINENQVLYRDLFENTPIDSATDPYWINAKNLFGSLKHDQRDIFLEVIRQTSIDTASNLLGIIDGVNSIDDVNGDFLLTYDGGDEPLNGDLQSIFLVEEERSSR
ncbi:MAG: hypothetical protein K0M49_12065 [Arenimonas sp.]|nr:hypothetical protein [Rhizobium sp.]MBW8446359.1 hypothetical protein [Arenimonas sp.]